MSRHKAKDPRGGHVRIYWDLLDCPAYLALSYSAKALYVDLRRKLMATNNGDIECTLATLRHRGWRHPATLYKALHELLAVGLLAITRRGGIASMSKICSLYRFTDLDVCEQPRVGVPACRATHDYRVFDSLGHAKATLRSRTRKKPKLQKLAGKASENESISENIAAKIEVDDQSKLQKVKLVVNA